jgi:hypothetical protein
MIIDGVPEMKVETASATNPRTKIILSNTSRFESIFISSRIFLFEIRILFLPRLLGEKELVGKRKEKNLSKII